MNLEDNFVNCEVTVQSLGKTGVEMEALTGVSIGLLTIYDMCKAVDRKMTIKDVRVLEKKVVNLVIGILDSLFVFLFACNSLAQADSSIDRGRHLAHDHFKGNCLACHKCLMT